MYKTQWRCFTNRSIFNDSQETPSSCFINKEFKRVSIISYYSPNNPKHFCVVSFGLLSHLGRGRSRSLSTFQTFIFIWTFSSFCRSGVISNGCFVPYILYGFFFLLFKRDYRSWKVKAFTWLAYSYCSNRLAVGWITDLSHRGPEHVVNQIWTLKCFIIMFELEKIHTDICIWQCR